MRSSRWAILSVAVLIVAACAGDSSGNPATNADGSTTPDAGITSTSSSSGTEEPDQCTLITDEEASEFAGHELVAGGDSFLGCSYAPPGEIVGELVVDAGVQSDAAAWAAEGWPDAADVIVVSSGSDTVAVTTPSGDTVAAVITSDGSKAVQLVVVFLDVDPSDPERLMEAGDLAVTALGRWQ